MLEKLFGVNSPQTIRRWKEDLITLAIIILSDPDRMKRTDSHNSWLFCGKCQELAQMWGQLIFDIA